MTRYREKKGKQRRRKLPRIVDNTSSKISQHGSDEKNPSHLVGKTSQVEVRQSLLSCVHFLSDRSPCGNFSDTSSLKLLKTKGSIGHAFTVCIHTENQNQVSFYPFVLHEISVLIELTLGHLRYHLTDVPPQPNSQPDSVFDTDRHADGALILEREPFDSPPFHRISKETIRVVVFHLRRSSHLFYTSYVSSQHV